MAWDCDVCGESIHYTKLDNGKIVPMQCPLEQYKTVRSFITPELQFLPARFTDIPLDSDPEDLAILKKIVPETTPLRDFVKLKNKTFSVKSALVTGSLRTFYLHFVRFLIDFYGDNSVHFIESSEIAMAKQFNYLWLSGTLLKDCFFRDTGPKSKFKSMSDLINPSLVIYALGDIESYTMKNRGDILLELLTSRRSHGKSTWIVYSKALSDCDEVKTSENLRLYLTSSNYIPKIQLDENEEDPEVFASPFSEDESGKRGRIKKVSKSTSTYNYL